ncbi:MAG: 50S ribosomal protein L4 [Candidatus Micrarchaeota archaeon]|nr:50S ribosomal protein L4 [Candidatus Micrarchaeota archaeon]
MKATVYSIDGKALREVQLPPQFECEVRYDLISRAAISDQTKHYQPKGNYPLAGMETSARYRGRKGDFGSGKNRGMAIRPREVLPKGRLGRVKRIPSAVKGRRAHPPHVNEKILEKVNKKEYRAALLSAIAATASSEAVKKRGHRISKQLPIVVENAFESLAKAKEAFRALSSLIAEDLSRTRKGKARSGVGCRRGGKRYPKSALVVVSSDAPVLKAARNIPGIDVVKASSLSVELLAPGAKAGRLALYSEAALAEIAKL